MIELIEVYPQTFSEIKERLEANQDEIFFLEKGSSNSLSIPVRVAMTSTNNESNIVSKWMDEILRFCKNALDGKVDKTITMNAIFAYCMAVKTSVTTK